MFNVHLLIIFTVMIDGAMVQHAGEAGAGLGGGLVDTLPQGLQPEHEVLVP